MEYYSRTKICKSGEDCKHEDGPILPSTSTFFYGNNTNNRIGGYCKDCTKWRAKRKNRALAKTKSGYVYFMKSGYMELIKIGFSTDIQNRLRGAIGQCAAPVELLFATDGTTVDERILLEKFAEMNHHGEWFYPYEELLEFIEAVKQSPLLSMSDIIGCYKFNFEDPDEEGD